MKSSCRAQLSEQGAIAIQAAVSLLMLMAFNVFVVDNGILWVSRQQAQNSADAGAAAGAVAWAYDDPSLLRPVDVASRVARANPIWFRSPGVEDVDVSNDCPPEVTTGRCVKVEVSRDDVPTLFAPLLNITSQRVRAAAIARVRPGNATDCLRPWAIPDRWLENNPVAGDPWTPASVFERYAESGPGAGTLLAPHDDYDPPTDRGPGTGLRFDDDLGLQTRLTIGNPNNSEPISPGWFLPLELPGANDYVENIAACNGRTVTVGQDVPTSNGLVTGPTTAAARDLIAQDPAAFWNPATRSIQGSCAPACASISPRLVALGIFNVDLFQLRRATKDWSGCSGGARCVSIVNIVGFFIDDVDGSGQIVGYLVGYPGLVSTGTPELAEESSFLKAITLVR